MRHWKSILGVALVFLFGVVCGIAMTVFVVRALRSPDRMLAAAIREMTRELDLKADQQRVVRDALTEMNKELAGLREDVKPQAEQIMLRARGKIERVLDENQKRRLDKYIKDVQKRRQKWLGTDRPS